MKRRALQALALAGVVLAVVATRVVVASRGELGRAETLREAGDLDGALLHYRRAAKWYAPGNPYHARALRGLAELGVEAEEAGETGRALAAWRAIRAAILGARSLYVPHRDQLDAANRRIAALMASEPPPAIDAGKSRAELRAEHLALLQEMPGPDPFWTFVLLLGFVAWVTGAALLATRGLDDEHRWVRREVLRWAPTLVGGFALFCLGLGFA